MTHTLARRGISNKYFSFIFNMVKDGGVGEAVIYTYHLEKKISFAVDTRSLFVFGPG